LTAEVKFIVQYEDFSEGFEDLGVNMYKGIYR